MRRNDAEEPVTAGHSLYKEDRLETRFLKASVYVDVKVVEDNVGRNAVNFAASCLSVDVGSYRQVLR